MCVKRFFRLASLLALLAVGALVLAGMSGAGVPLTSTSVESPLLGLGSCAGQAAVYAAIGYGQTGQVVSTIDINCAPRGAKVTGVAVAVNLRHSCSSDLNIRLDKLPRSSFLQRHNCDIQGGSQSLTFSEPNVFDGIDPDGSWVLYVTDWCDNGCSGSVATWSITVSYVEPTPVPPTPTKPTPTKTNTLRPTATPLPTPTVQPGCDHVLADFEYQVVCARSSFDVQFTDKSSSSLLDPVISWRWDFGDGHQDQNKNPEHRFFASGENIEVRAVMLTVSTVSGCECSVSQGVNTYAQHPEMDVAVISPASGPIYYGDLVTFRATLRNLGRDPYPRTVADLFYHPTGYGFVSASPPGYTISQSGNFGWSNRVRWDTRETLAVGAQRSFDITLRTQEPPPDPPGFKSSPHRLEAWMWALYSLDLDWCGNWSIPEAEPVVSPRPGPLTMTKTLVDPPGGVANVGDVVTFQIRVENESGSDVTIAALDDTFDADDLEFVQASPPPDAQSYRLRDQVLTWEDQLVPAGRNRIYTVRLKALRSRELVENCARYVVYLPGESDPSAATTSTGRACAMVEVLPSQVRAFAVDKRFVVPDTWSNQRIAYVGDVVSFETGWTNLGSVAPILTKLVDTVVPPVPASLLPYSSIASPPPPFGDSFYLNFAVPDVASPLVNTAEWTLTWPDGTQETQSESDWICVLEPGTVPEGLVVDKSCTHWGTPIVGDPVHFPVQITNVSGYTLTDLSLVDTYDPHCLIFQSTTPNYPVTAVPGQLTWANLGSLAPGQMRTIDVLMYADLPSPPTLNCAQARAKAHDGSTLVGIDCEQISIAGEYPDRRISKRRTSASPAVVNDFVDWEITVTNRGIAAAAVPLHDAYQVDWLQFDSASPMPDIVDLVSGRLDWNDLGPLAPGASHIVTVRLKAIEARLGRQNCAETTFVLSGQTMTHSACDRVDIVAQGAGIQVEKVRVWPAEHVPLSVGSTVGFSLTVHNVGDVLLSMVDVMDSFDPACLEYINTPMDQALQPAAGQVMWDLDPLEPGASV